MKKITAAVALAMVLATPTLAAEVKLELRKVMRSEAGQSYFTVLNVGDVTVTVIKAIFNNKPEKCTVEVNKKLTTGDSTPQFSIPLSSFRSKDIRSRDPTDFGVPTNCGEPVKIVIETDQGTVEFRVSK